MTEEDYDWVVNIMVQLGTLASRTGVSKIQDAGDLLQEVLDEEDSQRIQDEHERTGN